MCIENLDWRAFLAKYDRPVTLFYLDPPYFGCEKDYGKKGFERENFQELAEKLGSIKGKFIMTLNDVPEIRKIFGYFNIETSTIKYQILRKNKDVTQLIISSEALNAATL